MSDILIVFFIFGFNFLCSNFSLFLYFLILYFEFELGGICIFQLEEFLFNKEYVVNFYEWKFF